jgi:hypothetical protein
MNPRRFVLLVIAWEAAERSALITTVAAVGFAPSAMKIDRKQSWQWRRGPVRDRA